jgi:hypothetical protein
MGIGWRRDEHNTAMAAATSRWAETAEHLSQRFHRFDDLPLDEAVDAALIATPGNLSREELARRMAASREVRSA